MQPWWPVGSQPSTRLELTGIGCAGMTSRYPGTLYWQEQYIYPKGAAQMNEAGLTIGKLAKTAGVNVETIRYYQRVGLIQEPVKPAEGYRRYPEAIVARVCFIKRAKDLGFTLKEIIELLSLDDGDCAEVRTLAEKKHDIITQRIDDLRAMLTVLDDLIDQCKLHTDNTPGCAIIETLNRK